MLWVEICFDCGLIMLFVTDNGNVKIGRPVCCGSRDVTVIFTLCERHAVMRREEARASILWVRRCD